MTGNFLTFFKHLGCPISVKVFSLFQLSSAHKNCNYFLLQCPTWTLFDNWRVLLGVSLKKRPVSTALKMLCLCTRVVLLAIHSFANPEYTYRWDNLIGFDYSIFYLKAKSWFKLALKSFYITRRCYYRVLTITEDAIIRFNWIIFFLKAKSCLKLAIKSILYR